MVTPAFLTLLQRFSVYESGLGLRLGLYPRATAGLVLGGEGKEIGLLEPSCLKGGRMSSPALGQGALARHTSTGSRDR